MKQLIVIAIILPLIACNNIDMPSPGSTYILNSSTKTDQSNYNC